MGTPDISPQVKLATQLENATAALIKAGAEVPRPSDSYAVLGSLTRAQSELTRVFEQLAEWHAGVEIGVHHAGDEAAHESGNTSWARAEEALREAVEHSQAAATALGAAHTANGVASWYDELRDDA